MLIFFYPRVSLSRNALSFGVEVHWSPDRFTVALGCGLWVFRWTVGPRRPAQR